MKCRSDKIEACPQKRGGYSQFITSHYSPNTFLLAVTGNIVFNVALFLFSDTNIFTCISPQSYLVFGLSLVSVILRVIVSFILMAIWMLKTSTPEDLRMGGAEDHQKESTILLSIQAMYPLLMGIALSAHVLKNFIESAISGSPLDFISLEFALSGLKILPLVTLFVLRDTEFTSILAAWVMSLGVHVGVMFQLQSPNHLIQLLPYAFCSGLVFYDFNRQRQSMTQVISKMHDLLLLNEKLAVEAQALELRAMIGNVAHDLKTPLTSLLSGIECMTDILEGWSKEMAAPNFEFCSSHVDQALKANVEMLNCLSNMNSTNSFMTMTINRCLDYTKTSNGFKLVPKFETVSLKAALEMPAQLVEGAQHAITIDLKPLAREICTHIITDKQWLIENLMCLLSNAAKYSSRGCVEVEVFFETGSTEPSVSHNSEPSVAPSQSPRTAHRNARASTPTSGEKNKPTEPTQYLRFEVTDAGIGLSDEAMLGLFNPFKQAQRLAGGTGLGLYSLAKRVEALQGTYGVMRRPDGEQGSIFWFTIPYRPDVMSAKLLKQRVGSGILTDRQGLTNSCTTSCDSVPEDDKEPVFILPPRVEGPFHVLVVDDAPLIVKMTTMLLQRKGHTVQHAVNGADALEKLMVFDGAGGSLMASQDSIDQQEAAGRVPVLVPEGPLFDVVLMDLQMPVLDGIEAIRRLRAAENKRFGAVENTSSSSSNGGGSRGSGSGGGGSQDRPMARQFVIALSANSDEETRQEALAAGADAFVPKPFAFESFMDVMQAQV